MVIFYAFSHWEIKDPKWLGDPIDLSHCEEHVRKYIDLVQNKIVSHYGRH